MSKYVKQLVMDEIRNRLKGVNDALLVDLIGMDTDKTYLLRKKLREKDIRVLVVKTSLARVATRGTPLENAFEGMSGSTAVCWGASDFVQLSKEVLAIQEETQFEKFTTRGGVMDCEQLTKDRVKEVSKWPSRTEQLSLLMGQILAPGANLLSQLKAPGGALASQIEKKSKGDEA
jgi:large subunit ribosomal protein L10